MAKKRMASAAKSARSPRKTKTAKRPAKKASPKRVPANKKSAVKQRSAAGSSPVAKKTRAGATSTMRKRSTAKRPVAKRPAALGRPKVPGTAELDQMFLKDYEARQVFAFLRVKTIKELEEHPPDEIIERLTGPVVRTVERIRKALAVNNRYLSGDQKFAVQFCELIR